MNMRRFVLFLPVEMHKTLDAGAKRLKTSKAMYTRVLIETGEAVQKAARDSKK